MYRSGCAWARGTTIDIHDENRYSKNSGYVLSQQFNREKERSIAKEIIVNSHVCTNNSMTLSKLTLAEIHIFSGNIFWFRDFLSKAITKFSYFSGIVY